MPTQRGERAGSRVLVAGCGYVGSALAARLAAAGHAVWGLRRRPRDLPPAVEPLEADLGDPRSLDALPPELDFVFYTASAGGGGEDAYRAAYVDGVRHLLEALVRGKQAPRRIFFTSSTAVYAQAGGEWVDEDSPAEPSHYGGRTLLEGEALLREGPFPATVVRLGGIYGPGRAGLLESVRAGTATFPPGGPTYTNRIHRDDCAGLLHHLMRLQRPALVYLGVDCEPAERAVVLRWLAARLGAAPPREAPPRPGGRAARGSKRCRNARLLATGYRFAFPSFREGYAALLGPEGRDAGGAAGGGPSPRPG